MECTLGSIFRHHFAGYAQRHRLPLYLHRAAYWLSRCRTLEMGGHIKRCPEGHVEHASYNSCHQRYCPQCQGLATERWLQAQKSRLLACAHHHLIFTIPHELNALWMFNRAPMAAGRFAGGGGLKGKKGRLLACAHHHLIFTIPHELNALWMFNRAPMAQVLFAAVRDTLTELLADPKYLGARAAFLLALHTRGRSLVLHPHIHALVADGGLTEAGIWVQPPRSHFLPSPL